jgi:hypothetical protein
MCPTRRRGGRRYALSPRPRTGQRSPLVGLLNPTPHPPRGQILVIGSSPGCSRHAPEATTVWSSQLAHGPKEDRPVCADPGARRRESHRRFRGGPGGPIGARSAERDRGDGADSGDLGGGRPPRRRPVSSSSPESRAHPSSRRRGPGDWRGGRRRSIPGGRGDLGPGALRRGRRGHPAAAHLALASPRPPMPTGAPHRPFGPAPHRQRADPGSGSASAVLTRAEDQPAQPDPDDEQRHAHRHPRDAERDDGARQVQRQLDREPEREQAESVAGLASARVGVGGRVGIGRAALERLALVRGIRRRCDRQARLRELERFTTVRSRSTTAGLTSPTTPRCR